jgi:ferredoxin
VTVSTKTLHILGNYSPISFKVGENLLDTLNANKISISQSCEASGSCTTCRVLIHKGIENCTPRTEIEIERANERNFNANERLSCQTYLNGNVEIEILNPDSETI